MHDDDSKRAKPGMTQPKRIEIAYQVFDRHDCLVWKRKTVSATALQRTLTKLEEAGAMNIMTRDEDA